MTSFWALKMTHKSVSKSEWHALEEYAVNDPGIDVFKCLYGGFNSLVSYISQFLSHVQQTTQAQLYKLVSFSDQPNLGMKPYNHL